MSTGIWISEEYSVDSIISFAALGLSFAYTSKDDLARGKEYAELSFNKGPTPTDKLWSAGTPSAVQARAHA
jgi:hypothetical protein